MKLRGQRILLNLPKPPDTQLFLNEKIKNEMMEQQMKKMVKLEVFDVGELVDDIKKGDVVYIPVKDLQQADVVEIGNKPKALVNALSVAIIW
jgi:thiamine biosynthesis protein ThiC